MVGCSLSAMQTLVENPALSLRQAFRRQYPYGLLRWDRSGKALLVSDMPRREASDLEHIHEDISISKSTAFKPFEMENARIVHAEGLLYVDMPSEAYQALLNRTFFAFGPFQAHWFEEQATVLGILARRAGPIGEKPDEPLLRKAMLACALGESEVRGFCRALRTADATALRKGETASSRACAALLAHWLYTEHGVGLPEAVFCFMTV